MDIYVRIKRKKSTFFLLMQSSQTVLEVKQKLQEYIDKVRNSGPVRVENCG